MGGDMALKGTIADFSVGDIFQLLGQQGKTGMLQLSREHEQVHVAFHQGSVVAAERISRKSQLGTRLVRAGLIRAEQLDEALAIQKRSLERLGDILVRQQAIDRDTLREMLDLHVREVVYELFGWKSGTYAFEAMDVSWDPETVVPIRCEEVLMEGYRLVDEWPLVRRTIHSFDLTFERVRPLPPAPPEDPASRSIHLGEVDEKIGESERLVMELAEPGRTVTKLIDISRIGKFETCKALATLVTEGYLRVHAPAPLRTEEHSWSGWLRGEGSRLLAWALWAAAVAVLLLIAWDAWLGKESRSVPVRGEGVEEALSRLQEARIRQALEPYRLAHDEYPEDLEALLDTGLLSPRDLHRPWQNRYEYRRVHEDGAYTIRPPLR